MHQYYNFKWLNNNYVRNWDTFENSISVLKTNPNNTREYMFWEEDKSFEKKKSIYLKIMSLYSDQVLVLIMMNTLTKLKKRYPLLKKKSNY